MKPFVAALTALTLTGAAQAGNYGTCINTIYFTNYGVIAPSAGRQCLPGRFSQQHIEIALAEEYYKVAEQQNTAILRGDGVWVILAKSRDGSYVSEITVFWDRGI